MAEENKTALAEEANVDTTPQTGDDQTGQENETQDTALGTQETDTEEDEGYAFDWMNFDDSDKEEQEAAKEEEPEKKPATGGEDWWKVAAEKMGIEATDEESFKEAVKPKEIYVDGSDKQIASMRKYLDFEDENLIRAEYEAQNWNKKDIDEAIKRLGEDGMFVEANKIRAGLRQSIQSRQKAIENEKNQAFQQRANRAKSISQNVEKAISETEKIFGFKVAKDAEGLSKWRESMTKYITSGQLHRELEQFSEEASKGNPEKLIELAQLLRSKDGIMKGLVQKGKSEKTKEILEELENTGAEKGGNEKAQKNSAPGWFPPQEK